MNINSSKSERNSSIELLRLLSIAMIVSVHYLGSGILWKAEFGPINTIIARVIESSVIICVNIFILISGYFGSTSNGLNIRRIFDIVVMVAFFSGLSYIICTVMKVHTFSIIDFLKSLVPYVFEGYWFIRVYLLLTILSPFINVLIKNICFNSYTVLILILFVIFSLFPSFLPAYKNSGGYDVLHFIFIYFIGGYIRLLSPHLPNVFTSFGLYGFFSFITFLFSIYVDDSGCFNYDFFSVVLASCFLFMTFLKINFSSKVINYFAKSTLAVFVLENCISRIWGNVYTEILNVEKYMTSPYFIAHFAISVSVFTIIALIIDIIRRLLFGFTFNKLVNKSNILNKRILCNIEKIEVAK